MSVTRFLKVVSDIYIMQSSSVELPRKIEIGDDALQKVGQLCIELGLESPALVITDNEVIDIAGRAVSASLDASEYVVDTELLNTIDKGALDNFVKHAKRYKFIVGVGGGKIIDIAKYASFSFGVPFISVPTVPSHDGIVSPRATLNNNGVHYSFSARAPLGIVVDMSVISKAPYKMIAAGAGDMIAKITAIADWRLSHNETGEIFYEQIAAIPLSAAMVVMHSADSIRNKEPRGLRNLVDALISSGIAMCMTGSSRPASGSEHLFSHALDSIVPDKKSLHGEQCGVGSILSAYLHDLEWEEIRSALKRLGCPTNAKELGVSNKDVIRALVQAKNVRSDRYTIFDKIPLNDAKAEEIARVTGVIG